MEEKEKGVVNNIENVAIAFLCMLRAVKHGVTKGFDEEVVKSLEQMVESLDFLIEEEKGE